MVRLHPGSTLFPYTTLFRSGCLRITIGRCRQKRGHAVLVGLAGTSERFVLVSALGQRDVARREACGIAHRVSVFRSEEHTSELQSQSNLVCRLLLEKKKKN